MLIAVVGIVAWMGMGAVAGVWGPIPAGSEPPARAEPSQPAASDSDRAARWEDDLTFLAEQFPARHKNAFFHLSRERWDGRVAEIRARLPNLSDANAVLMIRQLVAAVGDGHSNVWIDKESAVPASRSYPVMCVWLADGVFTAVMPKEHEGLIGQRLVRIGDVPVARVLERVGVMQGHDNEWGRKNHAMQHLREAELLAGLGIARDIDAAAFTVADAEGKETTITVSPLAADVDHGVLLVQKPNPAEMCPTRRARRAAYGYEAMGESKMMYVWYDTCNDVGEKTVREFCSEALAALDEGVKASPPTIERVVIDLRRNGGGNSLLFAPMIDGLARRPEINQKGKLFALIGRRTFSSGMMNAYQLTNATACQLVGEPTGGSPNAYGEVEQFRLPNSKLVVQYSTKLFKGPKPGNAVKPDIAVEADAAAYFDPKRDVVLEACLAERAPSEASGERPPR